MTTLKKYIWVANELLRAGERGISLRELNERWVRNTDLSCGVEIPRKTFDRWKWAIEDLFGISIENQGRGEYRYYFRNPEKMQQGSLARWLLETYSTANVLSGKLSLSDRILVDEVPSSQDFLATIMEAMRGNHVVMLTHKKFESDGPYTFPVAPYCIKMFHRRWYLLAKSIGEDKIRLYGLDRIGDVELTGERFELPKDFDASGYFDSFFGIVLDENVPVERIIVRANRQHQHYLRTLPLHKTQHEIYTCDEYADFELYLRPTYDFVMELLHAGAMVEVLEPLSLRETMKGWVSDMWEMYG
ncbi:MULTISPECIES: helix-turn-helix transcriptional regulator [Bacteroidales]|uniref:helix-turn-helix transcriptional regulator n=1 Tax=Bacteroides pyogenes TaxID=310300 RepID=UPI002F928D52